MAEYASNGKANAALTTGIIGTTGVGLGLLGHLMGAGCNAGATCCSENTAVNRYELNLTQEIASKDARIGLLESQVYVDQKLTDVVKDYTARIKVLLNMER